MKSWMIRGVLIYSLHRCWTSVNFCTFLFSSSSRVFGACRMNLGIGHKGGQGFYFFGSREGWNGRLRCLFFQKSTTFPSGCPCNAHQIRGSEKHQHLLFIIPLVFFCLSTHLKQVYSLKSFLWYKLKPRFREGVCLNKCQNVPKVTVCHDWLYIICLFCYHFYFKGADHHSK